MILYSQHVETPIGSLFAAANEQGIFLFDFFERKGGLDRVKERVAKKWSAIYAEKPHPMLDYLQSQVQE